MSIFLHFILLTLGFLALILFVLVPNWILAQRPRYLVGGSPIPRNDMPLSPGEIRALLEVARGNSHKMAADNLGLSARTISNQLHIVFRKKRVSNITGAIAACLRDGDIRFDDILQPAAHGAHSGQVAQGEPATGLDLLPHETRPGCPET